MPPSTAALPPHRIRLEAATEQSSPDAFPTPAGAPTGRLPFGGVPGGGSAPAGPVSTHSGEQPERHAQAGGTAS